MFFKLKDGIYKSSILSQHANIIHGFSNVIHGDMKKSKKARSTFLSSLGLKDYHLIHPLQIHSTNIKIIHNTRVNSFGCDGLVYKKNISNSIALGARGADCCMILLSDPEANIIASVHAGWKGTLGNIIQSALIKMEKLGADRNRIIAIIGPYIHACCYRISSERAGMFKNQFSKKISLNQKQDGYFYIDIGLINRILLLEYGLRPENIDLSELCTSCNNDFYSFRRMNQRPVKEQIGIIAIKH